VIWSCAVAKNLLYMIYAYAKSSNLTIKESLVHEQGKKSGQSSTLLCILYSMMDIDGRDSLCVSH
jgi:hypothetical protein